MTSDKKLGLPTAIATGVGLVVATSCLVTLSQGVGIAGKGFIIVMAITCALNILVAFSFAELNSLMPVTGGLAQYTLASFGPFVGIISVVGGDVITNIFTASVEAAMIGLVITSTFAPNVNPLFISIIVVVMLLIVNLLGIKSYARTQIIVTSIMIGSMLLFGIIGTFKIGTGQVIVQTVTDFNPMGIDILSMTAMAFWLFIGIEYVTPISKDIKNPDRNVPLGMILGLLILFIVQSIMTYAISNYVSMNELVESSQPHMLFASLLLGETGQYWMAIISIAAVVSTLNTALAGISRMCYGMAMDGMLPKFLAKTNKNGAPYGSLIMLATLFIGALSTGITTAEKLLQFILTGCLFWMLAYIIAHMDVLILRKKYPNRKRGFSVKLFGLPQIVGILGMVYMIIKIAPEPELTSAIYKTASIWLIFLTLFAGVWVKKVMKKGLFQTSTIDEIIALDSLYNRNDMEAGNEEEPSIRTRNFVLEE